MIIVPDERSNGGVVPIVARVGFEQEEREGREETIPVFPFFPTFLFNRKLQNLWPQTAEFGPNPGIDRERSAGLTLAPYVR